MLLDTHTLIWALRQPDNLSHTAKTAISEAAQPSVSAASLYEITLKGRLGKWPEVSDIWDTDLDGKLQSTGIEVIPASGLIMQRAGSMGWSHRDPFDRMIVITALTKELSVISKDKTFDTLPTDGLHRIW